MQYHFEVCFSFVSVCDADYCVGQQAAERYAFPVMVSVRKGREDPSTTV